MKKLLSVLLAVMMLMSSLPVLADEEVIVIEEVAEEIAEVIAEETTEEETTEEETTEEETTEEETEEPKHECTAECTKVEHGICWSCASLETTESFDATCFEDGEHTYPCINPECGREHTFTIVEKALGCEPKPGTDTWYEKVPTCTEGGVIAYEECVHSTASNPHGLTEEVDPQHTWKEIEENAVVAPTCTEKGYTKYVCVECGATKNDNFVDKLGHDYYKNEDGTDKVFVERQAPHCDLPGMNVEFTLCQREGCFFKNIIATTSNNWSVAVSHQDWLTDLATPDAGETIGDVMDAIANLIGEEFKGYDVAGEYVIKEMPVELTTESEWADEVAGAKGWYHDVKVVVTPADCDDTGLITLDCVGCNHANVIPCNATEKVIIPAYGHNFWIETEDHASLKDYEVRWEMDEETGEWHYWVDLWNDDCTKDVALLVDCTVPGCDFEAEQIKLNGAADHRYYHDCYGECYGWDNTIGGAEEYFADGEKHYHLSHREYYQEKKFETVEWTWDFSEIADCHDYKVCMYCWGQDYDVVLNPETYNEMWFHINIGCENDDVVEVEGNGDHVASSENHAFQAPTCYEEGFEIYNCAKCGFVQNDKLEKLEHNMKADTKVKPTCEETGLIVWTCQNAGCSHKAEQIVPATGHEMVVDNDPTKTYAPDCIKEANGQKTTYCIYCGKVVTTSIPFAHSYNEADVKEKAQAGVDGYTYKAPTCTEDGSMSFQCTTCHRWLRNVKLNKLGHKYEGTVLNPANGEKYDKYVGATCDHGSWYERDCVRCPHVDKTPETAKLNHVVAHADHSVELNGGVQYGFATLAIEKLPTCTEKGLVYFNCARCGDFVDSFELPTLPHNEVITWNAEKREYEITCEPVSDLEDVAGHYLKTLIAEKYLYTEIAECVDFNAEGGAELAEAACKYVSTELAKRMRAYGFDEKYGDYQYIKGTGCGALLDTIKVNKTEYNVEMDGRIITVTAKENAAVLRNAYVVVSWAYTLSDGTSFTYTDCYEAKEDGEYLKEMTFKVGKLELQNAQLVSVTIAVDDCDDGDLAEAFAKGYGNNL